jgi:hypothetical protein
MTKSEKPNLFQKLAKARVMVQNSGLKQTGVNKFNNYSYFELGDFLNEINKANNEVGILSTFKESKNSYVLLLFDAENMETKPLVFTCRKEIAHMKGCHPIQNLGAELTYSRRYLYMQAYEIAESDAIDASQGKEKTPQKPVQQRPQRPAPAAKKPAAPAQKPKPSAPSAKKETASAQRPATPPAEKPAAPPAAPAEKPAAAPAEKPTEEVTKADFIKWCSEIGVSDNSIKTMLNMMTVDKAVELVKSRSSHYEGYKAPSWEGVGA